MGYDQQGKAVETQAKMRLGVGKDLKRRLPGCSNLR